MTRRGSPVSYASRIAAWIAGKPMSCSAAGTPIIGGFGASATNSALLSSNRWAGPVKNAIAAMTPPFSSAGKPRLRMIRDRCVTFPGSARFVMRALSEGTSGMDRWVWTTSVAREP
jgi:hypothetical protein